MNEEIFFIAIAIIYYLLHLTILIFSSIIILIIILNWHTHFRSVPDLLVCNSSFTFILYAISYFIQTPFMIVNNNNLTFCRLRALFTVSAASARILAYLSQALFRYFSTIHYRRKILLTFRVNILILLLGWIIPLIATTSMLAIPLAYQYEPESRICFLTTKYFFSSALISICVLFIPICIIILLYGSILRDITHQNPLQSTAINTIRYKRNLKVFHNILISIGIIVFGGIPFILSVILNAISKSPWILYSIITLSISLAVSLESMILFFTTKKVKKMFYAKIGYHPIQVQRIQMRRIDLAATIGNQILPINN